MNTNAFVNALVAIEGNGALDAASKAACIAALAQAFASEASAVVAVAAPAPAPAPLAPFPFKKPTLAETQQAAANAAVPGKGAPPPVLPARTFNPVASQAGIAQVWYYDEPAGGWPPASADQTGGDPKALWFATNPTGGGYFALQADNTAQNQAAAQAQAARAATLAPGQRTLAQFWGAIANSGGGANAADLQLATIYGEQEGGPNYAGPTGPRTYAHLADDSGSAFSTAISQMRAGRTPDEAFANPAWYALVGGPNFNLADLQRAKGLMDSTPPLAGERWYS